MTRLVGRSTVARPVGRKRSDLSRDPYSDRGPESGRNHRGLPAARLIAGEAVAVATGNDHTWIMRTKLPPHANAAAHERFLRRVKQMSSLEIAKTAEASGIYDANGMLTPAFGGSSVSSAPSARRSNG